MFLLYCNLCGLFFCLCWWLKWRSSFSLFYLCVNSFCVVVLCLLRECGWFCVFFCVVVPYLLLVEFLWVFSFVWFFCGWFGHCCCFLWFLVFFCFAHLCPISMVSRFFFLSFFVFFCFFLNIICGVWVILYWCVLCLYMYLVPLKFVYVLVF